MAFLGDFRGRAKIVDGNPPRNAITADLRRLVKKLWRCSKYPSLYYRLGYLEHLHTVRAAKKLQKKH